MTLDQLRALIRTYAPGANINAVPNATLDIIINKGVADLNEFGMLLKSEKTFDVVANQLRYSLSTNIPDFITPDKGGLWWNSGTAASPGWKELYPRTKKWLDTYRKDWRVSSAGDDQYYAVEPTELIIFPVSDTALTAGFWMMYIAKSVDMTLGTHYPFSGSTTEITSLAPLDDAIIDYARWKLADPIGKDKKGILTEADYLKSRKEKLRIVKRRVDISSHRFTKMRPPSMTGVYGRGTTRR